MDQDSLVREEIEAGAELVAEFNKYSPVSAAFWLKPVEDDGWTLYIAPDRLDETNFDLGYGEVLRLTQQTRSPYLDPFRVKLIKADDPLAVSARSIHKKYPGRMASRFRKQEFGGMSVDDAVRATMRTAGRTVAFSGLVVTSTLAFEGDGRWAEYVGGFSDWLRQRPEPAAMVAANPQAVIQPLKELDAKFSQKFHVSMLSGDSFSNIQKYATSAVSMVCVAHQAPMASSISTVRGTRPSLRAS